jgi:hypothetical protein
MKRHRTPDSGGAGHGMQSLVTMQYGMVAENVHVSESGSFPSICVKVVSSLRRAFSRLPALEVSGALHMSKWPGMPLRKLGGRQDLTLRFLPPVAVEPVGSAPLATILRGGRTLDIAVEMPHDCFRDRDAKGWVYADKRSMYLGVLATACVDSGLFSAVSACALAGDASYPGLLLTPAASAAETLLQSTVGGSGRGASDSRRRGRSSSDASIPSISGAVDSSGNRPGRNRPRSLSNASDASARSLASTGTVDRQGRTLATWRFRLIPTLPAALFKPTLLVPGWNNCRSHTLLSPLVAATTSARLASAAAPRDDAGSPTPHYNTLLLRDM